MGEVNVDNWKIFVDNNENALLLLNECATPIANVATDVKTIVDAEKVESINGNLARLKRKSEYSTIDPLPSPKKLGTEGQALIDWFKTHSVKIVYSLKAIETMIDRYNQGLPVDESLLEKIMQGVVDYGGFWMLYNGMKVVPGCGSLSFLLVYGTDAQYAGGNFVVGDLAAYLFGEDVVKTLTLTGEQEFVSFLNIGTGALAVAGYNFAKNMLEDEGEFTNRDLARAYLNAMKAGGEYAIWVYTAGGLSAAFVAAGYGAAVAGPLGAIGASVFVLVIEPVGEAIIDELTGDVIIDYADAATGGKNYPISRNGSGKNGTYDVILERTRNANRSDNVSLTEKLTMYRNLNNNGYTYDDEYTDKYGADNFNAFLKDVASANSKDEITSIARNYNYYISGGTVVPNSSITNDAATEYSNSGVYLEMENSGFNVDEYYAFTHNDYSSIAKNCSSPVSYKFVKTPDQIAAGAKAYKLHNEDGLSVPDAQVQAMKEVKTEKQEKAAELQQRQDAFAQKIKGIQEKYGCSYEEAVYKAAMEDQKNKPFGPKGNK